MFVPYELTAFEVSMSFFLAMHFFHGSPPIFVTQNEVRFQNFFVQKTLLYVPYHCELLPTNKSLTQARSLTTF